MAEQAAGGSEIFWLLLVLLVIGVPSILAIRYHLNKGPKR